MWPERDEKVASDWSQIGVRGRDARRFDRIDCNKWPKWTEFAPFQLLPLKGFEFIFIHLNVCDGRRRPAASGQLDGLM